MNDDKEIKEALKEIRRSGRKEVSIEFLAFATNIPVVKLYKRMNSFSKFGIVKPMGTKNIKFYRIEDF